MTERLALPVFGTLVSGTARGPVFATFLFRGDDPHVIVLWFPNQTRWTIGRELLAQGMVAPAGDAVHGDVVIWPVPYLNGVAVNIASQFGTATIVWDREPLVAALRATDALVPIGAEETDWDLEMRLLGDAR